MAECPACGKVNRDRAKFCRGCAVPLVPEAAPGAPPARTRARSRSKAVKRLCSVCQAANAVEAPCCQSCGGPLLPVSTAHQPMPPPPAVAGAQQRLLLWGVMMVAMLGLGAWWWTSQVGGGSPMSASSGAEAQAGERPLPGVGASKVAGLSAVPPAAMDQAAGGTSGTSTVSPGAPANEAERLRQSLERLEQEDRLHTALLNQQRKERMLEQRRLELQRLEQSRRRTEEVAAVPADESSKAVVEPVGVAEKAVVPVKPRPEPVQTVELTCAGSSNFFTRDLCRMRECAKPALAGDPTCVRFRQLEDANQRSLAQ